MDFVGAGLEADVDHAAFGRSGGDVEGRGLHFEFGDDVGNRGPGLSDGAAGFVVEGVAGAVEGKLVAAGGGSGHGVGGVERLPGLIFGGLVGEGDAVAEADHVVHVAQMDGQVADFLGADDASDGDVGVFEQGGIGGDGDGFRLAADFEREVEFHAIVDAERDAAADEALESRLLGGDAVSAGNEEGGSVVAFLVRLGARGDAGLLIQKGDGSGLDDGAAGIGDASEYGRAGFLRPGRGDRNSGCDQDAKELRTACGHGCLTFQSSIPKIGQLQDTSPVPLGQRGGAAVDGGVGVPSTVRGSISSLRVRGL